MSALADTLSRMVNRIGESETADRLGERVRERSLDTYAAMGRRGDALRRALAGEWLGHPLHPLLTDIPIGAWTSATVFDALALLNPRLRAAADISLAAGLLAAPVTAAAGHTDWMGTTGRARRIGLVHGGLNSVAVAVYSASAIARLRGRRGAGLVLGLAGMGIATAAGYLGGSLIFREGVGVENADAQPGAPSS